MPTRTSYMRAANRAHGALNRGFDMAWKKMGEVPLGHDVLDPRTMQNRMQNIAVMNNLVGMTSGLPQTARKMYQMPKPITRDDGPGQSQKNVKAGIPVDPTAHETFTGADQVSVDTVGGYGITPTGFPSNG